MTHWHHITPKSCGGTNEPDNLVEVSVEEHAEIHRCLWVYSDRWQDEVAWRALTGQIGYDEARRMAVSRARKGKPGYGGRPMGSKNKYRYKLNTKRCRPKATDEQKRNAIYNWIEKVRKNYPDSDLCQTLNLLNN